MTQCKIKIGLLTLSILLAACSSNPKHPQDPLEKLNRGVYGFNKVVDKALIKPVAYTYKTFIPRPIQSGVGNFFGNLGEVTTIGNDVLQLKIKYATHDFARLVINSTIGILGLFDVAGELGLDKRKEDFGQTLYTWGYEKSAYLVLPIIGPSTFRDGIGLSVDYFAMSVWPWVEPDRTRYALLGINLIDTRARLFNKETILDTIALDEYSLIRDAYLQHRTFLSTDGQSDFKEGQDPMDDLDGYDEEDKQAEEAAKQIVDPDALESSPTAP